MANLVPMTPSNLLTRTLTYIDPTTNDPDLWNHPMLDLFRKAEVNTERQPLLYTIPTSFGEEYDSEFAPQPTSAKDLPDLRTWTIRFALSVLEIWAAKRQPAQLARWCHHTIYGELVKNVGSQLKVGRIRKIYECQPLDGICETTLTIRFDDRIRSLVIRFEGVDNRWLCTSLTLL
jgi:hypothetical protein